MKEYLAELVRPSPTPALARNAVREYLQARLLGALQRAGAMIPLAFHGGTALHFLYATARYSKDLHCMQRKTWAVMVRRHREFGYPEAVSPQALWG